MEKLQNVSEVLAKSESRKERKLGKQLQNPKDFRARVYINKLYKLFLKSIDQESRERIMSLDNTINRIAERNLVNGGWHITDKGIFSELSKPIAVRDAEGNEITAYTFEMPRTDEGYTTQDYLIDTLDLQVIRHSEERFLKDHAEELEEILRAFDAKKEILDNGEYNVVSPEYQEILTAIENFFGYNQPKVAVAKK